MLEEFAGLPAHVLYVHAAVVLVPLLALLAVAYALIAAVRPHTRWVLGVLAVAAPVAALLAKLSGDAFFERLDAAGRITPGFYPVIENHQQLGNITLIATTVLGILTLALVFLVRPRGAGGETGRRRWLLLGLRALIVVAAAVTLFYVIRTGDSGARAVWEGY